MHHLSSPDKKTGRLPREDGPFSMLSLFFVGKRIFPLPGRKNKKEGPLMQWNVH